MTWASASASAGTDGGGDELLLLAGSLELGQLGLLAGDLLGRLGLGERTRLRGPRLGCGDLGLGLGSTEGNVALGIDLDLVRLGFPDGGLLVGRGLGHPRIALATGGLLLADQVHVARLVADRLDREGVDLEPGRREVALGRVLDGLLELHPVEVELFDRQRADDRAERAFEDVLDDRVDLGFLGLEEALGRIPDRLVVGADLERGDALDGDLDALPRHGVGERDVDLPCGQLELADLVEQRQDDDALAADDLEPRFATADRRRAAGPDQGLVRTGDLVAAAEVRDEQDDDDDREEDDERPAADEAEQFTHARCLPLTQAGPVPAMAPAPPLARPSARFRRSRSRGRSCRPECRPTT